ncbi:MAG: PTS sugar transporter subunit IIC [Deltaproteobacteria bacterium]|nr:PTS sugar transporter subunit IIC [Deltaproteobacteria bacterium]
MTTILEVALLGGFLCLDRVTLQTMISRPVMLGPLIGLFLGDPQTGIVIGANMELLWIDRVPVGAYTPPNDSIAAVVAAGIAILVGKSLGGATPALIALTVLIVAPIALVGQWVDRALAKSNDRLADDFETCIEAGDLSCLSRLQMRALAAHFLAVFAFIVIFMAAGLWIIEALYIRLSPAILRGLSRAYCLIPAVGVAVALTTIKVRGAIPLFAGTLVIAVLVREYLVR